MDKSMIKAVIFDLDGVIVSTDALHYLAWKRMADEEGIPFSQEDNERLRGVSRMASLGIILERASRDYTPAEREEMAERKNRYYGASLACLSALDILPGVIDRLRELRAAGIRIAIGSSSRNAGPILQAIGLAGTFDVVTDGTHIRHSKPDPEVFVLAGRRLAVPPSACLVVEDAAAGVEAGIAAGMPVLAVGAASAHPQARLRAGDLAGLSTAQMLGLAS